MTPETGERSDRIYLIDGMAQIFRAYYAIKGLSNSKGVPTNATFGFITMLRKLLEDHKPAYLGVVLDPKGPTVRHLQFEEYKAQRRPTPEDLLAQLPYIKQFCEAMNIPVLIQPEYEADDVIGTLTSLAETANLKSVIVTIDKDMFQLVSDATCILDPRRDNLFFDREMVTDKMGVPPEKIIDLLGLWGDASDNIPGAPGIGEKGALGLIRQFGGIEEALRRWEEVKKRTYRESLRDNASLILQSRDLATIHRDLPIKLELEKLKVTPPDHQKLAKLFTELEFTILLKSMVPDGTLEVQSSVKIVKVETAAELAAFWRGGDSGEALSFVLLNGKQTPGLAVCVKPGEVYLLPPDAEQAQFHEAWRQLESSQRRKRTHDLKSALLAVSQQARVRMGKVDDLMLMAYLVNPLKNDYSLALLAAEWLGVHHGVASAVTAEGAHWIGEIAHLLEEQLSLMSLEDLYNDIELPLVRVLADVEVAGVRIDTDSLVQLSASLERDMVDLSQQIFQASGTEFNLESPKQVGQVLFEKLKLPVIKRTRKTKGYSTDQAVLEELATSFEVPKLLLDYRQVSKLKSTYVDAIPRLVLPTTNRVHTSYNQTVAATGRLSSSNPNLQNIPIRTELGRKIRAAFISEPGYRYVSADYSQIELRVMAHLSEDPVMMDAFLKDQDIHERTASDVFGMMALTSPAEYRRRAKVINFGIIYGLSAFGLANQLQIPRIEAQKFIDSYFERYSGIRDWLDKTLQEARIMGQVRTICGRIRPIPELKNSNRVIQKFGERVAINTPIQGSAADLIKLAMVQLHAELGDIGLESRIILQVHDELVLECPEPEVPRVKKLLKNVMEGVYSLRVPLRADVNDAKNWKELK